MEKNLLILFVIIMLVCLIGYYLFLIKGLLKGLMKKGSIGKQFKRAIVEGILIIAAMGSLALIFDSLQILFIIFSFLFFINILLWGQFEKSEETQEGTVEGFINKVFSDAGFNSVISRAVPVKDLEEKEKLSYLPLMIDELEKRKNEFSKKADRFFSTTALLGLLFTGITIFFGWILLNDSTLGISKTVSGIKAELNEANINFAKINPSGPNNHLSKLEDAFITTIRAEINNLKVPDTFTNILNKVIEDYRVSSDFASTQRKIDTLSKKSDVKFSKNGEFILNVKEKLAMLQVSLNFLNSQYKQNIESLKQLLSKVETEIEKPNNQTNEIIKRLILSIIILSFFLTILRFVARQYQHHRNLKILVEEELMNLRKFIIVLKNTEPNTPERQMLINNFLNRNSYTDKTSEALLEMNKEEKAILKSFINRVLGKL